MTDYYIVEKEIEFDAGHRVPNHKSKCRNPHGHRYRLRTYTRGPVVTEAGSSDEGMVADFSDIKALMTHLIHDKLDHGFIVYENDVVMRRILLDGSTAEHDSGQSLPEWNVNVVPFVPTAENLAKWCYDRLAVPIASLNGGLKLQCVRLWETPTSVAQYPG